MKRAASAGEDEHCEALVLGNLLQNLNPQGLELGIFGIGLIGLDMALTELFKKIMALES
jgi:hypothetical protein